MASFKLCISEKGTSYQKEVKDEQAAPFIGLNIGEKVNGDAIGASGYELQITGGSDHCGFPMRSGILGVRKRISLYGGVGFSGLGRKGKRMDGMKKRKTVCGHKINETITQINLKVIKAGSKGLADALGIQPGEAKADKSAKKDDKKAAAPAEAAEKAPEKA
ncbi:MAG TPA: S6e family ribosomal protein [Candidatus Nanoarchaeia archaeon]|nr:S6e family ribosomal protein [Candidatus Nanoarchaeia archaeon]